MAVSSSPSKVAKNPGRASCTGLAAKNKRYKTYNLKYNKNKNKKQGYNFLESKN